VPPRLCGEEWFGLCGLRDLLFNQMTAKVSKPSAISKFLALASENPRPFQGFQIETPKSPAISTFPLKNFIPIVAEEVTIP
jgi:hypothetical protein